jgi:hypothetical protein
MSLELISIGSSNSCSSNPCCATCQVEVQKIQCFLPHRGYGKFNCDGTAIDFVESDGTEENPVKYLTYKTRGPAIIGGTCGGNATNKKDVTQTWTIDPYYGGVGGNNFTCYNGDEGVFSLCDTSVANVDSCSNTQRVYSCGQATSQEKTNYCIDEEDFEKTWTESLENSYSLDDVAQNVDSALSSFGFSNPIGTRGIVQFGTNGNKVLRWLSLAGGVSDTVEAKYERGAGGVYKEKSRIKFLQELTVTIITELDTGSVSTQEITFEKGQVYDLDPPNTPGRVYVILPATCSIGTSASTSCSGNITTKTNNNNNCTYFTAPDCELYNTKTTTIEYERNSNFNFDGGDMGTLLTFSSETNADWTFTDTACPATSMFEGSNVYKETGTERCIGASLGADPCYTDSIDNTVTATPEGITCSNEPDPFWCKWNADEERYRGPLYGYSCENCEKNITETEGGGVYNFTSTPSIEASVIICTYSESANYDSPGEFISGGEGATYDFVDNFELNGTKITTFSNSELDSEDSNVDTETCALGSNECQSCDNCSSWYITHNFESKKTSTVSVEASFIAPEVEEGEDPKDYRTYVQTIIRKDNTSNSKCANVILTSTTETYENSSTGGEIIINAGTISLPVEKDTSNCLIHVSAITFEVKSNE